MDRNRVLNILIFATIGLSIGVGLSFWEPDGDQKDITIQWIGLVGDLFLRALKCFVLPVSYGDLFDTSLLSL